MEISIEQVKDLRQRTGAGIIDCKAALQEAKGDMEGAIEYLRRKGLATAAKKAGRIAKDGPGQRGDRRRSTGRKLARPGVPRDQGFLRFLAPCDPRGNGEQDDDRSIRSPGLPGNPRLRADARAGARGPEGRGGDGAASLQHWLTEAKDRAVTLGELTREEAERVGNYLRRDVVDAASYLSETGRALKDWLRFDLDLIEDRLLDLFSTMVDETRLELDRLAEAARAPAPLHTGEVTGFGTLRCLGSGLEIEFTEPAGIPPCPR